MTTDLKQARFYFTTTADEAAKKRAMEGLISAKGYIRTRLAKAVRVRRVPEIQFLYDDSLDRSIAVEDLLRKAQSSERTQGLLLGSGKRTDCT
jgi:ribosome-binding factor A